MKFPFSYFNFHGPRAAPEASSGAGDAGSSGAWPPSAARQALSSRPGPRRSEDPDAPPARRRTILENAAGQSGLETLLSRLEDPQNPILMRLTAPDLVSLSRASTAMKAACGPALSDLKAHTAPGLAQHFSAVRSLTDFKKALLDLKHSGLARSRHEQLLTSLDLVMQKLPAPERQAALEAFVKSVDEFTGRCMVPAPAGADGGSPLMALRRAAQDGPRGLASFVTEKHGRPAINAGENAQHVAARLGVDSTWLEQMSAWQGSRFKPAGPAYRAVTESNEDFDRILQRFGIVNADLKARLSVAHKSAEAAVKRGGNVQEVIARFGIAPGSNEHLALAEASLQGPAGRAVREGMSPEDAERRYGLASAPFKLLHLKRIAETRDRQATEGQSFVEWALRGAGRLLQGAARHVLAQIQEDLPHAASRAAVRSVARRAGTPAAALPAATSMAAHGRIGRVLGGRPPGTAHGYQSDRIMAEIERDVGRLPLQQDMERLA